MKIIIICNCTTGLETFRGMLIQRLIEQKNEVDVIVPLTDLKKETDAEERVAAYGCRLIRIPMERRGMNPVRDLKLLKGYYQILRQEKPDMVLTYTIKPNIYGGMACRMLKIPYAVNITGLGTAFQKEGFLKTLAVTMYKMALKKAKVVFFENVENKDTLVGMKIVPENKTHVLAGAGVDLERFAYRKYPEDKNHIRFLFIGRVMQEKGVEELFAAMERLRREKHPCVLDVVGSFEENYEEIIKKYEKDGWLYYHGYQSDVRPFIENSHCFVLPSWHEGMANTNLECAATGRPVITSRIHGCMEAVVEGESGYLCECKSAESLYLAMKEFCELPYTERETMGIAGRRHMEDVFDKRKVVEETINEQQCK